MNGKTKIANAESHTHLQFTRANTKPEIAKEYVFANVTTRAGKKASLQQGLRKHRGSVVIGSSELLDSPPIQNFNNEKSKVNYKNIWLG